MTFRLSNRHPAGSGHPPGQAADPRAPAWALVLALAVALAGCGDKKEGAPAAATSGPAASAPPPVEVGVVTVAPRAVSLTTELPGRVEASRVAQVRARAAGIVQKRLFREGSEVKAGQPLFAIDSAPYQASLASAQATAARAQANLAQARAQAERYKPLVAENAISRQDYDTAVAAQKTGEADVAAANAAIRTARINLGYASVTAPISGRIGRALVTEGALVGTGEATELAVVQQVDPVYVNFTQSSGDVLRLRRALASGRLTRASGADAAAVRVVLEDGSVYSQAGRLLFSDLTVDATSGQITLRAEVPNRDRLLLPGMYVRVRFEQAQASDAITVPQQAVTRGASGDSVMVVWPDGKVASRPVTIGSAAGNEWVVSSGLKAGEQVMVDGFQKLRGVTTVRPVPWQPVGAASGASAPAGANPAGPLPAAPAGSMPAGSTPAPAGGAASGPAASTAPAVSTATAAATSGAPDDSAAIARTPALRLTATANSPARSTTAAASAPSAR